MAVGDKTQGWTSTANAGTLAIQPAAGTEWVIHNLMYGGAMELYFTDGSNPVKVDSDASLGRMAGVFHCTNAKFWQLKNVSGGTVYLGYDGVVTK